MYWLASCAMLRRVDAVHLDHEPHWLTGRGELWLQAGRQRYLIDARASSRQVRRRTERQLVEPVRYELPESERAYWHFENRWYLDRDCLDSGEVKALLITRLRRQAAVVSRARAQAVEERSSMRRGRIPDDVKQFVWARDEGRCAHCGCDGELQFDHVIPLALGGSSEAANLQVLCSRCNRRKGTGVCVG